MKDRIPTRSWLLCLFTLLLIGHMPSPTAIGGEAQGRYFAKKAYEPQPLPKFADTKQRLPSPIFDDNPVYVRMYWKAMSSRGTSCT
jgi:hypothetical protein